MAVFFVFFDCHVSLRHVMITVDKVSPIDVRRLISNGVSYTNS